MSGNQIIDVVSLQKWMEDLDFLIYFVIYVL